MNREGAETYLRVLAEAEMRGPVTPAHGQPWSGGPGTGTTRMTMVAQALTAVDALDPETAADIVADFDLALSVRQQPAQRQESAGWTTWAGSTGPRSRAIRFRPAGSPPGPSLTWPARTRWAAKLRSPVRSEPERPAQEGPDRFVLVGQAVPFRDEGSRGEMYLMSYAHTGAGARFTAAWRMAGSLRPDQVSPDQPGVLSELFRVTDDRGGRYELDFIPSAGTEWIGEVTLRPDPPDGIRWLDIAPQGISAPDSSAPDSSAPDSSAPDSSAGRDPGVRVRLDAGDAGAAGSPDVQVTQAKASPGEYLLTMFAERLLTLASDFSHDIRTSPGTMAREPLGALAAGLGDVIAALEAADVLSPLSPVPGWLATVCAALRISEHGITVPPALDLPEPWLSLLAHYQRRKPDTAPVRDGCAAVTVALPDLDGIKLAILGLHNSESSTWIQVLARGVRPERRHGPFGTGTYYPLSFWVRDSGGRWHATRPAGLREADGEYMIRMKLVPPLARSTAWVEVLAAGRSAEVRARLPLRWGYLS